jgi:hypothetical protein
MGPGEGFALDAMAGEVDDPYAGVSMRAEARLSWRF